MRKNKIDYFLHAFNSETDLKDLLNSIKRQKDLKFVNNLCYIENKNNQSGKFFKTSESWNNSQLNVSYHFDKLDLHFINETIQLRTSSGCPFSCAFCSYPSTAQGFNTMQEVSFNEMLKEVSKNKKIKNIIFIDDTLNVPKPRFLKLLGELKKYNFSWFSFLRCQFVDEEIIKEMKDSGCKAVYLGIESANDIVLQNMNKKATTEQFRKGIDLLKKYDIITMAAFIVGYPGETDETIEKNITFIENSEIDFYTLKEFYYMKHTAIYEKRDAFGLSGLGADWTHNTMDYKIASTKKAEMFTRIKNAVFIDPDTSLWHIEYLFEQGFSFEKIKKIQREINSIMQKQMAGNYSDKLKEFENIRINL